MPEFLILSDCSLNTDTISSISSNASLCYINVTGCKYSQKYRTDSNDYQIIQAYVQSRATESKQKNDEIIKVLESEVASLKSEVESLKNILMYHPDGPVASSLKRDFEGKICLQNPVDKIPEKDLGGVRKVEKIVPDDSI